VVDVPGVTGSAFFGAGPIAREPDPEGGDVDGGGVVVWAKEVPEISVTKPVTMMKGLSIERTPSRRERYHSSNIYSGAPMPYMQRITWSDVTMHLGVVPGYPASHGCIRLPAGSAERMWGLTKIGERVVIAPREVAPSEFVHPLLPVPKIQPSLVAGAESTVSKITQLAIAGTGPISVGSPKLLNPLEYAQGLKARAAAEIAAATKAPCHPHRGAGNKARCLGDTTSAGCQGGRGVSVG
jgi:hypothetical protein